MGLFGGIKRFVDWNRLGLQLSKLQGAFEDYQKGRSPMETKQNLQNAGKHLGLSILGVAGAAVLGYLSDPTAVGSLLSKDLSPAIALIAAPLIHAAAVWGLNKLKGTQAEAPQK